MISALLVKIYSFFTIVIFFVSSLFLYSEKKDDDVFLQKIATSTIEILKKEQEKIVDISNTKIQEPIVIKKEISTSTTQEDSPKTEQSQETDIIQIDKKISIQKVNPCITPINYKIGTFDTRFNISKNHFLKTINNSATLWNNVLDKKLFEYNPEGNTNLTLNLVYDSRQQNTDANKLLGVEIQNSKDAAEKLKIEYESIKATFTIQKGDYLNRLENFNNRQKVYNDTVLSWNNKGGAPRDEFEKLTTEKEYLQKESNELILIRDELSKMLTIINAKIDKYNELITFANERVAINNNTASKKFTEGIYNPNTHTITIYQFNDDIKLQRVITHELGHALGIGHTKSKESIMYAINNATTTELNYEDREEIKAICAY